MMTREEAIEYLNSKYHMEDASENEAEEMIKELMISVHMPWCRTKMSGLMPNYGSDCTCGAPVVQ